MKRALRFGRHQHLIGVVQEAEPGSPETSWGALLWNTGISNRGGPFRINVEIAEALAKRGITSLCFDLSRLGDSDDSGEKVGIQERSSRDIGDAAQILARDYDCQNILLIGLCSSAVDAYFYACTDERVRGLVMVDSFVFPTRRHQFIRMLQKVSSPARWQRFLGRKLKKLVGASEAPREEAIDYFEPNYPAPEAARTGLWQILKRDARLLVIYTGGFAPFFSYRAQFAEMLGEKNFGPSITVERWPDTDHLFTMLEDREKFIHRIDAWLREGLLTAKAPRLVEPAASAEESPKEADLSSLLTPILKTYSSLLRPTPVEADDHFFEIGGTSLQAIRAASELSKVLGFPVSVVDIYAAVRPRELARLLASRTPAVPLELPKTDGEGSNHDKSMDPEFGSPSPASAGDDESIAIIGIACRVPGAENWREFWENVLEGRVSIQRFGKEELDSSLPPELVQHPSYVPARGVIEGDRFDHEFFGINRREALFLDPQQRILLETCWQALEDAGYCRDRRSHKIAVYAGVGSNTYLSRNIMQGHAAPHSEEEFSALMANDKDYVATRIAYVLDLKGPAVSVHTACSTSLVAVIEAAKSLLLGDATIALAGAAAVTSPIAGGHLHQDGSIFSRDGFCRPFAAEASGTMFSDGAAVVVLKKHSAALRDGDQIYALIKGWGIGNDGREKGSFAAPSVEGQSRAVREAIARAGWSPTSIGYLESHGTATPIGDPIEIEGLRRGFAVSERGFCALGSVKANIGHLTAAAGTIGLIKAALAVRFGKIPPAVGAWPLNPELRLDESPFYLPERVKAWQGSGPRRAGVSSFGVGGTNSHVLLEAALPSVTGKLPKPEPASLDPWIALPVSAREAETAQRLATSLARFLPETLPELRSWSHALSAKRESFACHHAVFGRHQSDLAARLKALPRATVRGRNFAAPALTVLFPGQGSQYPQMGLGLAAAWPRFASHYEFSLSSFERLTGLRVKAALESPDSSALLDTLMTQASLFCLEWALAQSLLESGLRVSAFVGHSLGELVAATLAEVWSFEDAVRLVHARGRAMAAAPQGAMLAIRAARSRIEPWLGSELTLAAHNGPEALVVSGSVEAIARLESRLAREKIAARRLRTAHAFHSSMMDSVLPELASALQKVEFSAPRRRIISTVTGQALSAAEASSKDYWLEQLRQAVLFSEALQQTRSEPGLYLELGPRDALSRLAQQIHPEAPVLSLLAGHTPSEEEKSFCEGLSRLWSAGHELFKPRAEAFVAQSLPPPPYPFYGEKLWLEPQSLQANARRSTKPGIRRASDGDRSEFERLRSLLQDLTGLAPAALDPELSWSQLGLDSLMLTQWALRLQKQYGIEISLLELQGERQNLRSLAELLEPSLARETSEALDEKTAVEMPSERDMKKADLEITDIARIMEQQLRLMEQQLAIIRSLPGFSGTEPSSGQTAASSLPSWLTSLPKEGEVEIYTDQGTLLLPQYRGAFLAQDAAGQPALFIENPEVRGEFWQIQAA